MPNLKDVKPSFHQGSRHITMYKYCMDNLTTINDENKVKEFLVMNTDIPVQEIMNTVRSVMLKKGILEDIGDI